MAIINGTAHGETLSRTIGDDIIAGLGRNDQLCGDDGSDLLDGGDGHGHDNSDGGFGNDTLTGGAGNDYLNAGELALRDISAVPLFNIFRPSSDR